MSLDSRLGHSEGVTAPRRPGRSVLRIGAITTLAATGVWVALGGCNTGKPPHMSSSIAKKVERDPQSQLNIADIEDGEDVLPALRSGVECRLGEWCLKFVQCGDEYYIQVRKNGQSPKQFTFDKNTQLLFGKVLAGKIPCTMNKTSGVHLLGEGESPERAQVALHCKVDNMLASFVNLNDFTICGGDLQALMQQLSASEDQEVPHLLPVIYPDRRTSLKDLSFKKVP